MKATSDSTSITIAWAKPEITGRSDFYYNITYSDLEDQSGQHQFTSNASNPSFTISNLTSGTSYGIQVSVHNGVSDQGPDHVCERECVIASKTKEGGEVGFMLCVCSYPYHPEACTIVNMQLSSL